MRDGGKARAEYRTVCSQKDSIHLFILDWWLDAVCGADNWEVLLSHAENGHVQGALVVYVKSRYGVRYITPPPFTQYTGIWLDYPGGISSYKKRQFEKKVCTDLIDQLEAYAKENRIAFAQFHLAPQYTNWLPFLWRGYRQTTYYTFLLNIDDLGAVRDGFSNRRKRSVRAEENQYRLTEVDASSFFEFDKIHWKARGKKISYSNEFFQRLSLAFSAHSSGKTFWVCNVTDGNPVASILLVWDKARSYFLLGNYKHGKALGATIRMYAGMQYIREKIGLRIFDFEGSIDLKIGEAYSEYGSEQVPYFALQKIFTRNPLLRLLLKLRLY